MGLTPSSQALKMEKGESDGIEYYNVRSPDRSVCSYVARLDHAVVVTNSLYQIERLAAVANKKSPSIASLPEYVFFRDRYKLGDPEETGFVFLSDATIRRWCGPRWRIATSRRPATWPFVAELQAANMDRLAKKTCPARPDLHRLRYGRDWRTRAGQPRRPFVTPRFAPVHDPDRRVASEKGDEERGRCLSLVARRLSAQLARRSIRSPCG